MIIETVGLATYVALNKKGKNKGGKFNIQKNQDDLFNRRSSDINTSNAVVTKHYIGSFMTKR